MKNFYLTLLTIIAVAIVSYGFFGSQQSKEGDKHPDVDWAIGCQECHADVTPDIFEDWEMSKHGEVNFGCFICHGDGQETFHASGTDNTCGGCHSAQLVEFEQTVFKSCYDCHNGHTLKFHNE